MPAYTPYYRPSFLECLDNHKDKKRRIEKFVNRICDDPYYHSELLEKKRDIDLRGKRSRHMTGNYVLVFVICEECVKNDFKGLYNQCSGCAVDDSKRIIFLGFDKHDDIYATRWQSE